MHECMHEQKSTSHTITYMMEGLRDSVTKYCSQCIHGPTNHSIVRALLNRL